MIILSHAWLHKEFIIICWPSPSNQSFIDKLPATRGVWVIIGYRPMMRGVMFQQNSCMTLIGVHSTMHRMHPNNIIKVLQLLCIQSCMFWFYNIAVFWGSLYSNLLIIANSYMYTAHEIYSTASQFIHGWGDTWSTVVMHRVNVNIYAILFIYRWHILNYLVKLWHRMPYWSISEWRARIGSSWCALGKQHKIKPSIRHGARVVKKELMLNQVVTMMTLLIMLIEVNIGVRGLVAAGHHHQLIG